MKTKTIQKNIQLVRLLFEEQASRDDISLYDQLFAQDVVLYGPASGQIVRGLSALKTVDQGYHKTYPGVKFELEKIFGYDNEVVVRWTCRGTYKEGYKGISPKKKEFCIQGLSMYCVLEGKIQEIWQFWDRLGILEQVGEVCVHPDPIKPGYYTKLLKSVGMEKYCEKASFLSSRERECLELLLQGKTAKETATILSLSPRTIESYFENIKKKLKCSNKGQLFSVAEVLKKLELI